MYTIGMTVSYRIDLLPSNVRNLNYDPIGHTNRDNTPGVFAKGSRATRRTTPHEQIFEWVPGFQSGLR
jgi:hypothetical protein